MEQKKVTRILQNFMPDELASDLTTDFMSLRREVAINALGGSSGGKFVETFAQVLQSLQLGRYDKKPDVDKILRSAESWVAIDDGLRICGARLARAMYALRSKRNIVHKGEVDPNRYDLAILHHGAQWIVSELVRVAAGKSKEEAGSMVARIQVPVGGLVEDFDGRIVVTKMLSLRNEALLLLQHHYPDAIPSSTLISSMSRSNAGSVRSTLSSLVSERLVERVTEKQYVLTSPGLQNAIAIHTELKPAYDE